MLTLILGGARSGKSRLAQTLAMHAGRVTYVATASAQEKDPEMLARISHHRAHRPSEWRTIEEPLALADAVDHAASNSDVILVDCLTLWLSNLFYQYREAAEQIDDLWRSSLSHIAGSSSRAHVILVSNELGSGTVPDVALTRAFRDNQGFLNQRTAELADEVILTVAGLPLYLKEKK